MIKGDIDLTEKLDFYHDKPKEKLLPALPWKKDNGLMTDNDTVNFRWIHNQISNTTVTVINNDLELSWNSLNRDGYVIYNYYPTTTVNTSTNTTTTISSSSNSYLIFDYNTWNNEPIVTYHNITTTIPVSTNTNTWDSLEISYDGQPLTFKTKLDVPKKKPLDLPYKIKPKEYTESLMKYCNYCCKKFIRVGEGWNSGYCKECEEKQHKKNLSEKTYKNLKRTSWHVDDRRKGYYVREDKIFPWDNDGIYSHHGEIIEDAVALRKLKRRVSTSEQRLRSIPWLSKLHNRIFEDYKEELENGEKDYSSYLTNMDWLGIH